MVEVGKAGDVWLCDRWVAARLSSCRVSEAMLGQSRLIHVQVISMADQHTVDSSREARSATEDAVRSRDRMESDCSAVYVDSGMAGGVDSTQSKQ